MHCGVVTFCKIFPTFNAAQEQQEAYNRDAVIQFFFFPFSFSSSDDTSESYLGPDFKVWNPPFALDSIRRPFHTVTRCKHKQFQRWLVSVSG